MPGDLRPPPSPDENKSQPYSLTKRLSVSKRIVNFVRRRWAAISQEVKFLNVLRGFYRPTKKDEYSSDTQLVDLFIDDEGESGSFSNLRRPEHTDIDVSEYIKLPSLHQSISLEENPPPVSSRLTVFIIAGFIAVFIFWAGITRVDEVSVGTGQVIPRGFSKSIQHLEGGIIEEIFIKDGDFVKKGSLLIKMEGKAALSELEQIKVREVALNVKAERLRSLGLGRRPNFDKFDDQYKPLIDDQQTIYDIEIKNYHNQRDVVKKQLEQQKSVIAVQIGQKRDFEQQLNALQEQRDVNKMLMEKKLQTRTTYLKSEEELAEARKEYNEFDNQIQRTRESIAELENRLIELSSRIRKEALSEMGNVTSELAQVREASAKLKDVVKRLEILSTTDGVINGLQDKVTPGAVIQSGEDLMQIVPTRQMMVEARLDPRDIGNIIKNQKVTIKIAAYDYARFGGINGWIENVSASTFFDEKNNPYFEVLVNIEKLYVGENPKRNLISPGMTVEINIHTGKKSVLSYLTSPVVKAVKGSFRER